MPTGAIKWKINSSIARNASLSRCANFTLNGVKTKIYRKKLNEDVIFTKFMLSVLYMENQSISVEK